MEKSDTISEKQVIQQQQQQSNNLQQQQPPQATSNNPLYCSYVDGQFTYKDPNTSVQYVWNEPDKKWIVKQEIDQDNAGGATASTVDSNKLEESNNTLDSSLIGAGPSGSEVMTPGTSQVQFDGENYTYTDQDGTVFLWDSGKGAWFPKDPPSSSSSQTPTSAVISSFQLPPSPPDLSSSSSSSTQTIGFFNPNYSTTLTSPISTGANNNCSNNCNNTDNTTTTVSSGGGATTTTTTTSSRRFYYASLSPTSMGVNENPGLFLSPDDQVNNNDQVPLPGSDATTEQQQPPPTQQQQQQPQTENENELPPGWEKHEDSNGPYYWHVKSGTIQRERPTVHSPVTSSLVTQMSSNAANPALMIPGGMSGFVRRSNTVVGGLGGTGNERIVSMNEKRRSWVNYLEDDNKQQQQQHQAQLPTAAQHFHHMPAYEFDKNALKFAAVSLGCLSISEEDLTPERSSRAVSKVIAELTSGGGAGAKDLTGSQRPFENPSRIWTHTDTSCVSSSSSPQQMYLELTDSHLRVRVTSAASSGGGTNMQSQAPGTVLEQPIHSIRVWGVGREDPRDFAFVAREKQTRQFMCHVFRLDMYAKPLASSLRDACKKIMIERQQRVSERGSNKRPTSLGLKKNNNNNNNNNNNDGKGTGGGNTGTVAGLFPTPMDEPRKMIKAFYLGSKSVLKPTGMDVLNSAIDCLRSQGCERIPVLVSVAPSVIGITSTESPPKVQLEVRVRFLSFMGIGSDIRTCGIIIHTARDDFEAHCFYSTPSTGALCKAIEAACVLRYQKCLDAHHHGQGCTGGHQAPENNNGVVGCGGGGGSGGPGQRARSNPESNSSTTATSPKTAAVLASATASNLASALKTVFSSFGKAKSVEEK